MKVLITGGTGFIGYHLSKALAKKDCEVTICDNLSRGKMDDELKDLIDLDNVKFVECDLTKKEDLDKLEKDYDFLYHLAAINGTKHFYERPHEVLRVNVLATINLLDWFITTKCKKILFTSSSETYAGTIKTFNGQIPTPEDIPLSIEDIKNPRWSYGGSKILGELFFINYARIHNFRMSIIRYHNIYGPRMGYEHVIPEFMIRALKKQNPFKIIGGKETRAFCYIEDAVKATIAVMESEKTDGEIVHIGNSKEEITIQDLAREVISLGNYSPEIKILPAPEGSVNRRCPDTTKLKNLTSFESKISLNEGLKKTYKWYSKEA